jgi:3-oxoacyl-[acyl-carrier-protein] synthase-3
MLSRTSEVWPTQRAPHAAIAAIEYYLPARRVTAEELSIRFPEWGVERIAQKTGIWTRHIAADEECASDLAASAAQRLFDSGICSSTQIDFLLVCTQSPDYISPTTACILQDRLGIPTCAGALDFNLGCSGYIYGLGLAEGLIATGQAKTVLLVTADTYSKYIREDDRSCRTIFGDAAAATLIVARTVPSAFMGPFLYGTDGRGAKNFVVSNSGTRRIRNNAAAPILEDQASNQERVLRMDGNQMFKFAVSVVPNNVKALLEKEKITKEDIGLFVFHQANDYILEELRKMMGVEPDRFQSMAPDCANTVSSTIPIALKRAEQTGRLRKDTRVLLAGFGVGYSWGAALIRWSGLHAAGGGYGQDPILER